MISSYRFNQVAVPCTLRTESQSHLTWQVGWHHDVPARARPNRSVQTKHAKTREAASWTGLVKQTQQTAWKLSKSDVGYLEILGDTHLIIES